MALLRRYRPMKYEVHEGTVVYSCLDHAKIRRAMRNYKRSLNRGSK